LNKRRVSNGRKLSPEEDEKDYFEGYSHIGIHEEMLKDTIRTTTYRDAFLHNPSDFKDKIVLDVGCGSAILSFFAVQAGAKKVYGVDASDIIDEARKVVEHNKLTDKIILIKGKIEDIQLPEKVDIIISEWMGYFLLYESMLPSVLLARDKWLVQGGKIYPTEANIYIAPFEDEDIYAERVSYWENVYGIDYSPIIPYAKKCSFIEPLVEHISPTKELSCFPYKILSIDCLTASSDNIKTFTSPFELKSIGKANVHGFVGYFDVIFKGTDKTIKLSTSPQSGITHWRQCLFFFDDPFSVEQDTIITGHITIQPHEESKRALLVAINCNTSHSHLEKVFHIK